MAAAYQKSLERFLNNNSVGTENQNKRAAKAFFAGAVTTEPATKRVMNLLKCEQTEAGRCVFTDDADDADKTGACFVRLLRNRHAPAGSWAKCEKHNFKHHLNKGGPERKRRIGAELRGYLQRPAPVSAPQLLRHLADDLGPAASPSVARKIQADARLMENLQCKMVGRKCQIRRKTGEPPTEEDRRCKPHLRYKKDNSPWVQCTKTAPAPVPVPLPPWVAPASIYPLSETTLNKFPAGSLRNCMRDYVQRCGENTEQIEKNCRADELSDDKDLTTLEPMRKILSEIHPDDCLSYPLGDGSDKRMCYPVGSVLDLFAKDKKAVWGKDDPWTVGFNNEWEFKSPHTFRANIPSARDLLHTPECVAERGDPKNPKKPVDLDDLNAVQTLFYDMYKDASHALTKVTEEYNEYMNAKHTGIHVNVDEIYEKAVEFAHALHALRSVYESVPVADRQQNGLPPTYAGVEPQWPALSGDVWPFVNYVVELGNRDGHHGVPPWDPPHNIEDIFAHTLDH